MQRFPRSLLIGLCLGLTLGLQSATAQPATQWTSYRNASGTSVPFPADLFTVRGGEGTPRGEVFWLAAYDVATAKRRWYKVERDQWSVHFNISPDQRVFSGDGGDSEMVAHAKDGKWLYLFHPKVIPDVAGIHAPDADSLITAGTLDSEKLVDLAKHDYRLEPNAHFTPDGKWLVFRSNMEGTPGIYAVEIAR